MVKRGVPSGYNAKAVAKLPREERLELYKQRLLRQRIISGECWLWTGMKGSTGYGSVNYFNKNVGVHRVSFELFKHTIQKGKYILHRCNNYLCFNPDHLYEGTQKENVHDSIRAGTFPHALGEDTSNAKLTNAQVLHIKQQLASGIRQARLREQYCLSSAEISKIATGKRWAHIEVT